MKKLDTAMQRVMPFCLSGPFQTLPHKYLPLFYDFIYTNISHQSKS